MAKKFKPTHTCSFSTFKCQCGTTICGGEVSGKCSKCLEVFIGFGGDLAFIERKEVRMTHCTLCKTEMPAVDKSGVDYLHETLCGRCLKAARKVCLHSLKKEDGITCRDCGAQPWTAGRVVKGVLGGVSKMAFGIAKMFVAYTIASIMGSIVTLGLAYLFGKKMGFLP